MTIEEANIYLKSSNVNPLIFNIGSPKLAECFVVERLNGEWVTYVWERGKKNSLKRFEDEDLAAKNFVREVMSIARNSVGGFV